jgi:hypothetical protein
MRKIASGGSRRAIGNEFPILAPGDDLGAGHGPQLCVFREVGKVSVWVRLGTENWPEFMTLPALFERDNGFYRDRSQPLKQGGNVLSDAQ